MNSTIKRLLDQPRGPKVSLFLEWSQIDHNFEEVRVWLSHAIKELNARNMETPPVITRILEDQRVFGQELELAQSIRLGERYAALYFGDDEVVSIDSSLRCKDTFFVDDEFFILPLLKTKAQKPILALFVKQDLVRAFRVSNYKRIEEMTAKLNLPEGVLELSHLWAGDETGPYQKGEMPRQIDHKQDYQEELLKKFCRELAGRVSKYHSLFSSIHIFASTKLSAFFKSEMAKINRGVQVISHAFVLDHLNHEKVRTAITEKALSAESVKSISEEIDFTKEPITNVRDLIWEQELGNLRLLKVNERWLAGALGDGNQKPQLMAFNRFILDCMNKGVEIFLSPEVDGIMAGELYGNPVHIPGNYQSGDFAALTEIKY